MSHHKFKPQTPLCFMPPGQHGAASSDCTGGRGRGCRGGSACSCTAGGRCPFGCAAGEVGGPCLTLACLLLGGMSGSHPTYLRWPAALRALLCVPLIGRPLVVRSACNFGVTERGCHAVPSSYQAPYATLHTCHTHHVLWLLLYQAGPHIITPHTQRTCHPPTHHTPSLLRSPSHHITLPH